MASDKAEPTPADRSATERPAAAAGIGGAGDSAGLSVGSMLSAAAPIAADAHGTTACAGPFGAATVQYPVEFELRVIYLAQGEGGAGDGEALGQEIGRLVRASGGEAGAARPLPAKGPKYGRLAMNVRFDSQASMRAAYAAVGALPAVKALM